jgi:hypothetical protein
VALTPPSRPSRYRIEAPTLTPWVKPQDIEAKGAVVAWPATSTRGLPPPSIQQWMPALVPEVPRAFERFFQGRLPLTRIGWSVVRPAGAAPPAQQ